MVRLTWTDAERHHAWAGRAVRVVPRLRAARAMWPARCLALDRNGLRAGMRMRSGCWSGIVGVKVLRSGRVGDIARRGEGGLAGRLGSGEGHGGVLWMGDTTGMGGPGRLHLKLHGVAHLGVGVVAVSWGREGLERETSHRGIWSQGFLCFSSELSALLVKSRRSAHLYLGTPSCPTSTTGGNRKFCF